MISGLAVRIFIMKYSEISTQEEGEESRMRQEKAEV